MADYTVKIGMTRKEVEGLLGPPTKEATMEGALAAAGGVVGRIGAGARGLSLCAWRKRDGTYTIYFKNGVADDVQFDESQKKQWWQFWI
jgi:hypothetical protein